MSELIHINLLPRTLRPKKALIAFDYRVAIGFVVIIAVAGLAGFNYYVNKQVRFVESDLANWQQAERMLKPTIDLQNEVKSLREEVTKRVQIIKDLTGDSDLRFNMLKHINMITPSNLWLQNISERMETNTIVFVIEGMSYTKEDISTFLANLEKYETFTLVALESIRPAPMEIRDAYQFSVRIEMKSLQPVERESEVAAGRRRRR